MTSNSFAAGALEVLLSWFKSLVNGVMGLFSGTGGSMLAWLSNNWLPLLILFLVIGTALDVVVYLLRWRPFWWWFRKKRLVVDDRALHGPRPSRRPHPTSKIPVRQRTESDEEAPAQDGSLFMEPSLFDVKDDSPKRRNDALYAPERRPRSAAKRPKVS